jgi:hypothetical protein
MISRIVFAVSALVLTPALASAGEKYRASQGWQLSIPAGWKSAEQQGRVMFGSDTEAGLIVAWSADGVSFEEMRDAAAAGIHDGNVSLSPIGDVEEKTLEGGRALVAALRGVAADGSELRAHAVGVLGKTGTSVAIVGITTPEKIKALAKRVDQMAASLKITKPKAGKGAAMLATALCAHSGGDVASVTRRLTFDGRGNAGYGSEVIAGGTFKDGAGNTTGSWGGYSGDQYDPRSAGRYTVQGETVTVSFPDETFTCSIHFRQQDGRITELQCGDRLYGASLCE